MRALGSTYMQRRMAAIMVGDIVGYSAMMEKSEERTIERLEGCRAADRRTALPTPVWHMSRMLV